MKRPEHYPPIKLIAGGQEIEFYSVIVGGSTTNENETLGFYGGPKDLGEFGVATMQSLRGVVKFAQDEFDLSIFQAVDFVKECLAEAVRREMTSGGESHTIRQVYRG